MGAVDTSPVGASDLATPSPRRFTVEEYHRLIEAGILGEDEHVELHEGVIVQMSPQSEPGARVLQILTRFLNRNLGDEYVVRPQLPVTFRNSESEPEPDLAVVHAADAQSREEHPETALLAIEISITSLRYDRTVKARIYARAGIPEYWIVNVKAASVEVFRDPHPPEGSYRTKLTASRDQVLESASVPGLSIPVASMFG